MASSETWLSVILIGVSRRSPTALVTALLVRKKGDNQRLVWDCRNADAGTPAPPAMDLGGSEHVQDVPPGIGLWVAQGMSRFLILYFCELPNWLRDRVCLDLRLAAEEYKSLGLLLDLDGAEFY